MALKDFKLTDGGDIILDDLAKPTVLLGQEAINQIVKMGFSLWLKNWFRDPTRGVDWLGVLKKQVSIRGAIDLLTTAIIKISFVTEVIDIFIQIDKETRVAKITYFVVADRQQVTGSIEL